MLNRLLMIKGHIGIKEIEDELESELSEAGECFRGHYFTDMFDHLCNASILADHLIKTGVRSVIADRCMKFREFVVDHIAGRRTINDDAVDAYILEMHRKNAEDMNGRPDHH